MEKTLVILKPSCVQRALIGEVISRFEKKGLQLVGMKMIQLTDDIIDIHYAHLVGKPYFQRVKDSMKASPVIVQCWQGIDAATVVRKMMGVTNGRNSEPGTIRGDFSMSNQENITHASESADMAKIEIKRFFEENELFNYKPLVLDRLYANDEA